MSRMNEPTGQEAGQAGQMGEKSAQFRQAAQEQMEQIREAGRQYYEQGRQAAAQYYEQGRQKAMEWEEGFEDYVREQPVKSVLIAAGIGLVLGFLWRRS